MKLSYLLTSFVFLINTSYSSQSDPFVSSSQSSHELKLLNLGLASLEARLQMIESAQKSIEVEYFIYNLDKSGKMFTQALIKKASQGVKVRMLLDYALVKKSFSSFFAHEMKKYGIEVKYFNPSATLNQFSGTYRNHRKALIVDGEMAITGGRNIGDEYFDLSSKFNFLDRDLFVKGEIVTYMQATFNEVWDNQISKNIERPDTPNLSDKIYKKIEGDLDENQFKLDLKKWNHEVKKAQDFLVESDELAVEDIRQKARELLSKEYRGTCDHMNFYSEYPIIGKKNRKSRIIKHNLISRITEAKESVLFDSPYFIVNQETQQALDVALANKVNITLLTNSLYSTDAIYVYDVFDSIIKNWIKKGLHPYIYKGTLPKDYEVQSDEVTKARFGVHAKSFVFDNNDVVIGTFNFDPRSANLNTEMTISCEDNPELAKKVTESIEGRIKNSHYLDSSKTVNDLEYYNVSFVKRFVYLLLKWPANVFDYLL